MLILTTKIIVCTIATVANQYVSCVSLFSNLGLLLIIITSYPFKVYSVVTITPLSLGNLTANNCFSSFIVN